MTLVLKVIVMITIAYQSQYYLTNGFQLIQSPSFRAGNILTSKHVHQSSTRQSYERVITSADTSTKTRKPALRFAHAKTSTSIYFSPSGSNNHSNESWKTRAKVILFQSDTEQERETITNSSSDANTDGDVVSSSDTQSSLDETNKSSILSSAKDKALTDALEMRERAKKVRLEAERLDAILTLEKIEDLESKLSKFKAMGTNENEDESSDKKKQKRMKEEEEDMKAQIEMLRKKLIVSNKVENVVTSTSTLSSTLPSLATSTSTSTETIPPISEKELKERIDAYKRSPTYLQNGTAKATDIDDPSDAEAVVRKLYQDEQMALISKETSSSSSTSANSIPPISEKELKERLDAYNDSPKVLQQISAMAAEIDDTSDAEAVVLKLYQDEQTMSLKNNNNLDKEEIPVDIELLKETKEGFDNLPTPIKDMVAKSLGLKNADNSTAVMELLISQNRIRTEDGKGVYEIDSDMTELFENTELMEISDYVQSMLPKATRKDNCAPNDKDIDYIFTKILGKKIFNPTSKPEIVPGGVIIRGENKMKSNEEMLNAIEEALSKTSINDRVEFFFIRDPTPVKEEDFEAGTYELPLLLIMGKDLSPDTAPWVKPVVSTLGFVSTAFFAFGAFSFNDQVMERLTEATSLGDTDLSWLSDLSEPLLLALFVPQFFHELAHLLFATKDKMKIGLPTIVPSLQLGLTGCITPLLSPPKSLNSLFDFALAGPLTGMLVSALLLYSGLEKQVFMDATSLAQLPSLPVEVLRSSSLGGGIIEYLLGDGVLLSKDPATMLKLHPLAIAGYVGLLSNALNLLPIGNTDGGRIAHALFGRSFSRIVQAFVLLIMVVAGFFGADDSNILLFYALLTTTWQRETEIPCRNEVDELDDFRAIVAIAVAFLVGVTVVPINI